MNNEPHPIYKVCKNSEVITLEALNDTTYEKCYFKDYQYGKPLENPRKVKVVNVQATTKCKTVTEYFNQLIKTEGYAFM